MLIKPLLMWLEGIVTIITLTNMIGEVMGKVLGSQEFSINIPHLQNILVTRKGRKPLLVLKLNFQV